MPMTHALCHGRWRVIEELVRSGRIKPKKQPAGVSSVTYHDSCNPARGMGFFEEPRYVIQNVCNHFYDMPASTIREQTFCCGSGAGLNAGENMELRLSGGMPRANAVKHVRDAHGVNMLACICAIERPALWLSG